MSIGETNTEIYSIYTLADPRTPNDIRYVGFTTKSLHERKRRHVNTARNKVNSNYHTLTWLRTLLNIQLKPEIDLIDCCNLTDRTWKEQYWISQLKAWGFDLVNATEGGDGNINPSLEIREKIRKKKLGTKTSDSTKEKLSIRNSGIGNPMFGKKLSIESILKSSNSKIGKKLSEDIKKKQFSRPVLQYDCNGYFIKEFNSSRDAETNTNVYRTNIMRCCNGKVNSAGGFIWLFKDLHKEINNKIEVIVKLKKYKNIKAKNIHKQNSSLCKPVLQYDINNNLINEYYSISEAANKLKVSDANIIRCCKGKKLIAYGFIWKYKK